MATKICKYANCGKEFTPNHGKQLYCSKNCKAYDHNKNKSLETILLNNLDWKIIALPGEHKIIAKSGKAKDILDAFIKQQSGPDLLPDTKFTFSKSAKKTMTVPKVENPVVFTGAFIPLKGQVPPIPVRLPGEDPFDFANRKNEWKRLYQ